ncbi:arylamine N-acetyltransferase family protein [Kitasatospora sp. KL5]|uniref:arylamine N-acetyltransferase family protein n=1 Tax=Kitasatospora sp. KL5 TaxID=3425125 RepID=UPI003D6E4230
MLSHDLVGRYLHRLGLPRPSAPTAAALAVLHRAHVERVPYEDLEIQLGRPTTVDPVESAERIVRGRGGYCFHLNGAFSALLAALGFDVTRHLAGVQRQVDLEPVGAAGNHMALTVRTAEGPWLVDVGLGDGLYEPLPLRAGSHRQGSLRFGLTPSAVVPGGWRLEHDPAGSFRGMEFSPEPADPADFAAEHTRLSTSPESAFVQFYCTFLRNADGFEALRGCVLLQAGTAGREAREVTDEQEWFALLTDRFGLDLSDVGPEGRAALWQKVHGAHMAWKATQPAPA